ncbi:MAG: hypothetical protein M5T61_13120 [Acidimicrobiia bacterium]|nr:hypothetical protein [Acidimicrobiia bacterium]
MSTGVFQTVAGTVGGTEVPGSTASGTREGSPPRIVAELRDPLDGIVRSLHRLSVHGAVELRPSPDSPRLLHRARSLAGELRGVVDELLGPDGDGTPGERRVRSETLPVVGAFEDAAARAGDALRGRHVTVSCPPRLTVTTDADHFENLLALLLRTSAREPGEVHAAVHLDAGQLVVTFAGLRTGPSAGHDLDLIHAQAARLGGSIDVVAHPHSAAGIRVRLPQQRTGDGGTPARNGKAFSV